MLVSTFLQCLTRGFSIYLVTGFTVQQDPPHLNHLSRILCNVDTMFVTGCRNVYDHVTVKLGHA